MKTYCKHQKRSYEKDTSKSRKLPGKKHGKSNRDTVSPGIQLSHTTLISSYKRI